MTSPETENQEKSENSDNTKEYNFRMLEAKYEKQLAQERAARLEAEQKAQQFEQRPEVEEDDDEPYVDVKKLEKKLAKFGEQTKKQTQSEISNAVQSAIKEEKKQNWLKTNLDFYDVLKHADRLAEMDPELAEVILEMPDGFERQKLAYKNIKALKLHEPARKEPSIQEKIDSNRRSPYYQPTGIGSSPYSSAGDFSAVGQKSAYEKMQELKRNLRL